VRSGFDVEGCGRGYVFAFTFALEQPSVFAALVLVLLVRVEEVPGAGRRCEPRAWGACVSVGEKEERAGACGGVEGRLGMCGGANGGGGGGRGIGG
jgi:hypothetical protein